MKFKHILESEKDFTIASSYNPGIYSQNYFQTEQDLENALIDKLKAGQYEYASNIKTEKQLLENLKIQIEKLNNIKFSPKDWERFLFKLTNPQLSDEDKINLLQKSEIINFTLEEDGDVSRNIYLIKKDCYSKNCFQVINQYTHGNESLDKHRYDVVILVNGLPLVLIELKRRGQDLYSAFEQVCNYKRYFSKGKALFDFLHIFIISNGTFTKYFSPSIAKEKNKNRKDNNNYGEKFWINWADQNNTKIDDLLDFGELFLWKNKLFNILFKYCIVTKSGTPDWSLKIMRPYQIAASELIINKISISRNSKKHPKDSGGFIWHSTGSGKTLTSFKTVSLIKDFDFIKKVLFVVDRKDLDGQTQKRFNEFEEGSALKTDNTNILKKNLESENPSQKVIITTIQKLSRLLKDSKSRNLKVFNEEVVIIFDECHRSQFGTMHKAITKAFKKYYIFGFTGTPIFSENHNQINKSALEIDSSNETTTKELFGDLLHSYTMKDAVNDNNVLKFQYRSYVTWSPKEKISEENKKLSYHEIDKQEIKLNQQRISNIVSQVIKDFDSITARKYPFSNDSKQKNKLNGLFVAESIEAAKKYYNEFKKQIQEKDLEKKLKIAVVFSCSPNAENLDIDDIDENDYNPDKLSFDNHDFLKNAINDYYKIFQNNNNKNNLKNNNFKLQAIDKLDSEKFSNYYKHLTQSIEDVEIDLVIVVNMLLTGFDSVRLGALWIDKRLKLHSLIQAFSRTNRIYNNEKKTGQIISFIDLEDEIENAFRIFTQSNHNDIVILKGYQEYLDEYEKITDDLKIQFPITNSNWKHSEDEQLIKKFVQIFNKFLELHITLNRFTEFENNKKISHQEFQDYQSCYKNFSKKIKNKREEPTQKHSIVNDIEFKIELLKEYEINNIQDIINSFHETKLKSNNIPKFLAKLENDLDNSEKLKSKKEVIMEIFEEMNGKNINTSFEQEFSLIVKRKLNENIHNSIKLLNSQNININVDKFEQVIKSSIKNYKIIDYGSDFESVIESDWTKSSREEPTKQVISEIEKIYNKFSDIYAF